MMYIVDFIFDIRPNWMVIIVKIEIMFLQLLYCLHRWIQSILDLLKSVAKEFFYYLMAHKIGSDIVLRGVRLTIHTRLHFVQLQNSTNMRNTNQRTTSQKRCTKNALPKYRCRTHIVYWSSSRSTYSTFSFPLAVSRTIWGRTHFSAKMKKQNGTIERDM